MNDKATVKRADFTPAQRFALLDAGQITAAERKARGAAYLTYPIDDIHPEEPSDRDDGIFVRQINDGSPAKYRVEVTVADVAGYIAPRNPLADVAHDRASTEYWPWGKHSMFPPMLENLMSLENKKERLGMMVMIDLDDHYQPIHTELKPVITEPQCKSYQQAQELIATSPNFKLIHQVAEGIRSSKFAKGSAMMRDLEKVGDGTPKQAGAAPHISISKLVATYMILTNHAVAKLFDESQLPCIYHNYEPTSKRDNVTRAVPSTRARSHAAIKRMGYDGAYCHFTSPIRRGQDFYNGQIAHYVVNVIAAIEQGISDSYTLDASQRAILHRSLWDHAAEVMQSAYQPPRSTGRASASPPDGFVASTTSLKDVIRHMITQAPMGLKVDHAQELKLQKIEESVKTIHCPYDHKTLEEYAEKIKAINQQPRDRALAPPRRRPRKAFANVATTGMQTLDQNGFSSLLIHCARTGELSDQTLEAALARLKAGELDMSRDALTIMIRQPMLANHIRHIRASMNNADDMPDPVEAYSKNWDKLKSAMASRLKKDPQTVNNICHRLGLPEEADDNEPEAGDSVAKPAARPKAARAEALETDGCTLAAVRRETDIELIPQPHIEEPNPTLTMHRAIISFTDPEGRVFSAPFYSLGNKARSAFSHAKYSFIEHFAFSQLVPLEEARNPHNLYEKLNDPNVDKLDLLQQMASSIGATSEVVSTPGDNGRYDAMVIVHGGKFIGDLETTASDDGQSKDGKMLGARKAAEDRAIRRMFQNKSFAELVSLPNPEIEILPNKYLIERAQENGMRVVENVRQIDDRGINSSHCATITLQNAATHATIATATSESSKKTSAVAQASWQLLTKMGWVDDSQSRGWATEHVTHNITTSRTSGRR